MNYQQLTEARRYQISVLLEQGLDLASSRRTCTKLGLGLLSKS